MTRIPPERLILALPDIELEKFVREWVLLKKHMLGFRTTQNYGDGALKSAASAIECTVTAILVIPVNEC